MNDKIRKKKPRFSNVFFRRLLFFLIVFFICILVFGAIASVAIILRNNKMGEAISINDETPPEAVNVLLIGTNKEPKESAFLLIKLDFLKTEVPVTALPTESIVELDGREDTLGGHFAYGGNVLAVKAAEEFSGVKIDKFAKASLGNFESIIDKLGGVVYDIPGNLIHRDNEGKVIVSIETGKQRLTGQKTGELLRYPKWPEGRREQTKIQERVFESLINQYFTAETLKIGDILFKFCVNFADTDISYADYSRYLPWLNKVAESEKPAKAFSAGGEFSEQNGKIIYSLSDSKKSVLIEKYR